MISMLVMILLMATMVLTIADIEQTEDYARNKKTMQASDSGIEHGEIVLAHAISSFNMPAAKDEGDIDQYAIDADSNDTETQLSLLFDTGEYFQNELYVGTEPDASATTESTGDLNVGYAADINVDAVKVDLPDESDISHRHVFYYDYEIASQGASAVGEQANRTTRLERGSFEVEVKRPSFATYGYFTQSMKNQFEHQLVFFDGEVYDGPTHVNSAPPEGRAGFYGSATFNGPFTAVQERYEDSWLGGDANPIFNDSVTWGVDPIDLPENGWSQLRASIGDYDNVADKTEPSVGWEQYLIEWMNLPIGTTELSQGVYYTPNYNSEPDLMGGIMVWGNAADVSLSLGSFGEQVMTITMSNDDGGEFDGDHTWVFREIGGNTFVSVDGAAETMYNGSLNGLIHVEGNINSLGGGGTSAADIEENYALTVSATQDIYITDHITYEVSPVDDPDVENILGIFSSGGNIMLAEEAPYNLNLQATVMAASANHGVGAEGLVVGTGYDYNYPYKENWNLLGGLIENKNQTTGVFYSNGHRTGYNWNFTYDERFLEGKAPPYFPYVTKFVMNVQNAKETEWGRKFYD
ncbi:hypothetical protein JW859_14680 [bacterium]|nr:hypothetical protein [bacterium]